MSRADSANIDRAKRVIAGERIDSQALLDLVKTLKDERAFGLARRILEKHQTEYCSRRIPTPGEALKRKLTHQLSLCTYKDPDLNPLERLDRALEILNSLDNLDIKSKDCTRDQETLGQAGAIFKRKWELTSQRAYLDTSLAYYAHGYAQGIAEDPDGPVKDRGYAGINAAFVLDLLTSLEASETEVTAKAEQTRKIREDIVAVVPGISEQPGKEWLKKEWWFLVTIAEAYFGLRRYEDARPWLQQAAALPDVPEWEWETSTRQLARLL
ncbi:MAG: tetratricopeptide repeat-containing protein, partial [Burkholderiales bacterium]